jgi:pimeloyl-ACP methyl ester carboxylesterase
MATGGIPVIMWHGYTDSWFSFSKVLPLLDTSIRVYILDQRGHGDSDRPVGGYAMQQFARRHRLHGCDEAESSDDRGPLDGQLVAQHVAAEAPSEFAKLVLIGSATRYATNTVIGCRVRSTH